MLDGEKTLISNVGIAHHYVVFANADPALGRKGITAFLVERDAPGLSLAGSPCPSPTRSAASRLDGCRVPARRAARRGRRGLPARAGDARRLPHLGRRRRERHGAARARRGDRARHARAGSSARRSPISSSCRRALADMATELDAARLLVARAAHLRDTRRARRVSTEAAMAKMYATEAAQRIIDRAVQLHGGAGVCLGRRGRARSTARSGRSASTRARPRSRSSSSPRGLLDRSRTPAEGWIRTMWKPPQRIRHELPVLRAPTAAEAARSLLFSPLTLASGLALRERTWVPAMVPWRATEEGFVTPDVLDWYGRFADGRAGRDRRRGHRHPRRPERAAPAHRPRPLPPGPRASWCETVRRRSRGRTRLFIQIIDFLRIRKRPPQERYLGELPRDHRRAPGATSPSSSATPAWRERARGRGAAEARRRSTTRRSTPSSTGARSRRSAAASASASPTSTTPTSAICRGSLPGLFAAAAERAQEAGFDGVELHYAHAYTMASFLSALNTRTDGYGGPREARVRLPLEVFAAARARVGARLHARAAASSATTSSRAAAASTTPRFFGVAFARAGMDFLSLSTGGKFEDAKQPKVGEAAYPYTGPSGYECMPTALSDERGPFARQVPKQAQIRAAVRAAGLATPTVVAGGISTFDQAEGILAARRGRPHRRRAPVARRPGLVPQAAPRAGRRDPALHLLELLRGARPEAQAGDLPALGPRGDGRAGPRARGGRPAQADAAGVEEPLSTPPGRRPCVPRGRPVSFFRAHAPAGATSRSIKARRAVTVNGFSIDRGCTRWRNDRASGVSATSVKNTVRAA